MQAYDNPFGNGGPRRIVEIFITDPNQWVPLDHAVIYHAERFASDKPDSELFMAIPIVELTAEYNKKRVTFQDKSFRESDVFLEEIKPRDLRFVVRTITAI